MLKWPTPLIPLLYLLLSLPLAAAGEEVKSAQGDKLVITAAQIRKMNLRSVQELLNLIPGVRAGTASVSIRGSSSVRVLLDGMPLNDPSSRGVRLELVPFQQLEKVVVIKGGGGVAFGDDSSGGVVLFITSKVPARRIYLEAAGGKLDMRSLRGEVSRTWRDWGISLSGRYRQDQGYRPNNDQEEKRLGLKLSYTPENWGAGRAPTLALDYGERRRGVAGYPSHPTPRARANSNSLGCSLLWERWGIKSGTYFTRFRNHRTNPDRDIDSLLTTWTLKQDLGRSLELPLAGKVRAGFMLANYHGEGSGLDPRDEQSLGLFLLKRARHRDFSLRLGLRANLYSEFASVLNPELELAWQKGGVRLFASVAWSNNIPSFRRRYFSHSTLIPNPDLGMERSVNYGLGLSWRGSRGLGAEVSLFDNEIRDRITYVRGDSGVGQYQNLGETYLRGLDAAFSLRPFKWLEFNPSYTYLEARDRRTGLWLTSKPRHKIKADLILRPLPGIMLACHYTYSSQVFTRTDNRETGPAYHLVNLRGEYRWKRYRLFAELKNLLDQDYYYADGLPAPPRTWQLGLGCEF